MHPVWRLHLVPWSQPSGILLHITMKSKAYATTSAGLLKTPSPGASLAFRIQVKFPWMPLSESSQSKLLLLAKIPATYNYQLSFHSSWMLVWSSDPSHTWKIIQNLEASIHEFMRLDWVWRMEIWWGDLQESHCSLHSWSPQLYFPIFFCKLQKDYKTFSLCHTDIFYFSSLKPWLHLTHKPFGNG